MFVNGHGTPTTFLTATVIPIPKNVRLDYTTSSNYRPTSLSSIFCKVLDKTMLNSRIDGFQPSNL